MKLDAFFHAFHRELVGLGVACDLAFLCRLGLQGEELLGIGHLQPLPAHIMGVREVVDAADPAAAHLPWLRPVIVQAGPVGPGLEGYVVTQVVLGRILDALHQAVVQGAPQVVALFPGHLADLAHRPQAQLRVALVASRLLALAGLAHIAGQRAVVLRVEIDIDGVPIQFLVVQEEGGGHPAAVHDMAPVAVGIGAVGFELGHHGQKGAPHHLAPGRRLPVFQEDHAAEHPVGLDQAQRRIVAVKTLQGAGIGVDDFQRFGVFPGLGALPDLPHIPFAASLRPRVLPVAGHHLVGTGHPVGTVLGAGRRQEAGRKKGKKEQSFHRLFSLSSASRK